MIVRAFAFLFVLSLGLIPASCRFRDTSALSGETGEQSADLVAQLEKAIQEFYASTTEEERKLLGAAAWKKIVELDKNDPTALQKAMGKLVSRVPQTKSLPPEQQAATAALMYVALKTEIENRGTFTSWNDLANSLPSKIGGTSEGDALRESLETLGQTPFVALGTDWDRMDDGAAAWNRRDQLMRAARKSVWVLSWAFYNDGAGNAGADALIALHNKKIDVRVIVDGPVSSRTGYTESVAKMEAAGIPVIRWYHPQRFGFGMHRKMLIIDHTEKNGAVVFGGKNFGDQYSNTKAALPADATQEQKRLDTLDRWRDTDIMARGTSVAQAANIFVKTWNEYASSIRPDLKLTQLSPVNVTAGKVAPSQDAIALIDQNPVAFDRSKGLEDPVFLATLKMIASAKREIMISNAYFITMKPLEDALFAAMDRGVVVRVHTNANESMAAEDKPLLGPIYRSLRKLVTGYGLPRSATYEQPIVHLQKDRTLHSKYMVVDGTFGWVGSYNIHPRSARYESETVGMFHGAKIGQSIRQMFLADTSEARARSITDQTPLQLPPSQLFDLLESFIFEQL
jgi:cardiolipin synthase